MVVVSSGSPPWPCCNGCPKFVELSVVFDNPVVLVHHLGVQRLVHTFLILTLLLLLTVQFFGIADVFSMHPFNVPCAVAFQRSDCLMLLFLQGLLHFPNLVLEFCSSTPQPLASLLRHSSAQPEACRDRPSTLPGNSSLKTMPPRTLSFHSPL